MPREPLPFRAGVRLRAARRALLRPRHAPARSRHQVAARRGRSSRALAAAQRRMLRAAPRPWCARRPAHLRDLLERARGERGRRRRASSPTSAELRPHGADLPAGRARAHRPLPATCARCHFAHELGGVLRRRVGENCGHLRLNLSDSWLLRRACGARASCCSWPARCSSPTSCSPAVGDARRAEGARGQGARPSAGKTVNEATARLADDRADSESRRRPRVWIRRSRPARSSAQDPPAGVRTRRQRSVKVWVSAGRARSIGAGARSANPSGPRSCALQQDGLDARPHRRDPLGRLSRRTRRRADPPPPKSTRPQRRAARQPRRARRDAT